MLDASGAPIPGAAIEIWQCDATGIYRHPRDTGWFRKRDGSFQGRGRDTADAKGGYSFRTIKPVAYPGRTPHIHFAITAPGREALITQMYVAGEAQNERDGILNGIRDQRQRDSVIVALQPGDGLEPQALLGTFDIVLARLTHPALRRAGTTNYDRLSDPSVDNIPTGRYVCRCSSH